jgi:hypothetical protein
LGTESLFHGGIIADLYKCLWFILGRFFIRTGVLVACIPSFATARKRRNEDFAKSLIPC